MIHSLQFILLTTLFTSLVGQDQKLTDCKAGTYFLGDSGSCEMCMVYYWSQDAWAECKACPTDDTTVPNHKHCMCDTQPPRVYGDLSYLADKECNINGTLTCSRKCFQQARKALTDRPYGMLTKGLNIMSCDCDNPTTMEDCEQTKHFTNNCFINACDGERFYDSEAKNKMLDSCYKEYKSNGTCDRDSSPCRVTNISSYLVKLRNCNCFHYDADDELEALTECNKRKKFYEQFETICTPPDVTAIITIAVPIAVPIAVLFLVMVLGAARYYAVQYLRQLKNSGLIEKIMSLVVWTHVEALGVASLVIKNPEMFPPRHLSDKEIVLKIRFALIGGTFGAKLVRPQHVVLKIFSENRCEAQATELRIINSFHDKSKAKANNIISVYGPPEKSSNEHLATFLKTLVDKSESLGALSSTINQRYLDRENEQPRCHYIMMNHCNELSLSEFIKNSSLNSPHKIRQLCKDLAKALNFLHEGNLSIDGKRTIVVHCDIKPDNIFVKERRKKTVFILGDFGFAGIYHEGHGAFKPKGHTWNFTPPEWVLYRPPNYSLVEENSAGDPCPSPCTIDIYQYGLIVWLALHNKTKPWDEEFKKDNSDRIANAQKPVQLDEFLKNMFTSDPGKRPQFSNPNYTDQHLRLLVETCWQQNVIARPTASEILRMLDEPTNGHTISHNYAVADIPLEPVIQI